MKILNFIFFLLITHFSFSQKAHIELQGGEIRKFKTVNLIQEKYEKPYLKTDDGSIYRMEQIQSFQNEDGYFVKNELTKNKNDFSERVLNGRVSIFRYDLSGNFIQDGQSSQKEYYAYQKYNQPLKQMIYSNLIKDLDDNVEAIKKLNKIESARKIAPLYYVLGGISVLTAGILFNTEKSDLSTPFFIGGIRLFSIPRVLNSKKQKRMDDAVRIYNAD